MPNPVLTQAIDLLAARQDLSVEQSAAVLAEIMAGNASETQTAAVLIALRTKGETVDELVGLATTMRLLATPVTTGRDDLIDTAGTGGGRPTFNVSTTAALIAAGAGCAVAKHGNRSATGLSGSADLLEALGVRIDLAPEAVAQCIEEAGFGFMFAPAHHGATRHVVPVRKELAVRTIFNFLGPLTNPAGARAPGDRRLGPGVPAHDRRGAGPSGRPEGAGSVERRRTGRDEHGGHHHGRRGRRLRDPLLRGRSGGRRPASKYLRGRSPAAPRSTTPRSRAASSPASTARRATSRPSTRARRSTSRAGRTRSRAGVRAAEQALDSGARRRGARHARRADATIGPVLNVLERIVGSTREELERRRRAVPLSQLEAALDDRPEGRPVRRGARAPRHLPDRRAQAPLAVGRRRSARARR